MAPLTSSGNAYQMSEYFFRAFILAQYYICDMKVRTFIVVLHKVFERIITDIGSSIRHHIMPPYYKFFFNL